MTPPAGVEKCDPFDTNDEKQIHRLRFEVARRYLSGVGLEVGAGARPFPLPDHAQAIYGDIRDNDALVKFFRTTEVISGQLIDAQTLAGFPENSFDFLVSAHVIEHLRDPLGAIVCGFRVLKAQRPFIIVVPEMGSTFDRNRPETTVEHALRDFRDGGESTCFQAYEEHLRFVHPYLTGQHYEESEIQRQAAENTKRWRDFDVHFHAWTKAGFAALLHAAAEITPFRIEETVTAANENIFVLRRE
ncbi:MAG: methyltransferase domain-containing protein [Chthoniobacterales bacterium]|nr:methyltransferase domain-containing protein [Chthoniobacterales bacterium]